MTHLSRRDFLKAAGLAFAASACAPLKNELLQQEQKLNVLFIAIDDLNDWTGCLQGHPDVKTPNLDKLASKGVLFTRAYCSAPACNPSRASLMTGIGPSTSGVYLNSQPWRKSPVLKDAHTLPQHFQTHGYKALGSGKIYHGKFPDPKSWDVYWPSKKKAKPDDPQPENKPLNGIKKTGHFDWGPLENKKEEMGDWKVASWVGEQLGKKQDKPFFLACGFYRPHLPWYVPKEYFDLYPLDEVTLPLIKEDDLDDVPEPGKKMAKPHKDHKKVIKHKQWKKAVQAYLASISFTDECLGRVLKALDEGPHHNNTIVVLWSDHGWHLGEKLHWRKFALWEEAAHNVLCFTGPGIEPGRCPAPVSLLDIYPTLIDLCGLSRKNELEGESLFPLMMNPLGKRRTPALTTHGKGNHSVRDSRWRYIRYKDGSEELYDHHKDELEWTNLADMPEHARVKEKLSTWLPDKEAPDIPIFKKKNKS